MTAVNQDKRILAVKFYMTFAKKKWNSLRNSITLTVTIAHKGDLDKVEFI